MEDAPIIVLDPDIAQAHRVAGWLRSAGLGMISPVRTCDEAIFTIGRRDPSLLIIDDQVSEVAERRLLRHIAADKAIAPPALVRLVGDGFADPITTGRTVAREVVRKPLDAHDVVVRVGSALQRSDLLPRLDRERDESIAHLAAARRMQLGLLPTTKQIDALQTECEVGLAGFWQSGDAVGGDFWGAWTTGRGRFALTLVDFAGHGLSAALNTFRLHAILSDQTLPRGAPTRMTALLNQRLHAVLPRGHYATMIYAQIDPASHQLAWSSAGGPEPIFVSAEGGHDLRGSGMPLGVKLGSDHRTTRFRLPGPGVLCLFSDGLYESGSGATDVPRDAVVACLAESARLAADGDLSTSAEQGIAALRRLRGEYACPNHSDDVMAVCVAFGPRPARRS